MNKKKRLTYLDVCKGILILLLLVNHFFSATSRLNIDVTNNYLWIIGTILITFTPCFMQAFFFISGYCSNFNKSTKTFMVSQCKQILIPYFTFSLLAWILPILFPITDNYTTSLSTFGTGFWFFNALFFSKIILFFILKYTNSIINIILILSISLISGIILDNNDIGINFFYFRHGLVSIFFVGIGYLFKNRSKLMNYSLIISAFLYPTLILLLKYFHMEIPLMASGIIVTPQTIPLFLLLTLTGTFAFIQYSKLIPNNKFFIYFGQNSLIVYGIHFYILMVITQLYYKLIQPDSLYTAIIFFISLYCTLIIVLFCIIKIMNNKYISWSIGKF